MFCLFPSQYGNLSYTFLIRQNGMLVFIVHYDFSLYATMIAITFQKEYCSGVYQYISRCFISILAGTMVFNMYKSICHFYDIFSMYFVYKSLWNMNLVFLKLVGDKELFATQMAGVTLLISFNRVERSISIMVTGVQGHLRTCWCHKQRGVSLKVLWESIQHFCCSMPAVWTSLLNTKDYSGGDGHQGYIHSWTPLLHLSNFIVTCLWHLFYCIHPQNVIYDATNMIHVFCGEPNLKEKIILPGLLFLAKCIIQYHQPLSKTYSMARNMISYACQSSVSMVHALFTYITSCHTGISLGIRPANERRCYNVTTSPIGWVHTKTDPWSHNRIWYH